MVLAFCFILLYTTSGGWKEITVRYEGKVHLGIKQGWLNGKMFQIYPMDIKLTIFWQWMLGSKVVKLSSNS